MALFTKSSPQYLGGAGSSVSSQPNCKTHKGGFVGWIGGLFGFPNTPCYTDPKPGKGDGTTCCFTQCGPCNDDNADLAASPPSE